MSVVRSLHYLNLLAYVYPNMYSLKVRICVLPDYYILVSNDMSVNKHKETIQHCTYIKVKGQRFYCCSIFHSCSKVFNNENYSCTEMYSGISGYSCRFFCVWIEPLLYNIFYTYVGRVILYNFGSSCIKSDSLLGVCTFHGFLFKVKFEDAKGVIRSRKSKDRQIQWLNVKRTKIQTMIHNTLSK